MPRLDPQTLSAIGRRLRAVPTPSRVKPRHPPRSPEEGFWAKIMGSSAGKYSWRRQRLSTSGGMEDHSPLVGGTLNAVEVNGIAWVRAGTIVWLRFGGLVDDAAVFLFACPIAGGTTQISSGTYLKLDAGGLPYWGRLTAG